MMGRSRIVLFSGIIVSVALVCMVSVHAAPSGKSKKPGAYSRELEMELRDLLFANYSKLQRPEKKVLIKVWFTLLTIKDMSIKDQTLSLSGYFNLHWLDDRLAWENITKYTNIRYLFSTQRDVWRPTLVVENSVTELSVISNDDIPMRIRNGGMVSWSPADVYVVSCESDITYYPMDIQSCILSLTSWAYTSYEVQLRMSDLEIVTKFYTKNGEWELLSGKGVKKDGSQSSGGISFSNIKFAFVLRRRPLFYFLNTLFPVALMALVSTMVFKLPAESGEKIGFSLTVQLAYALYLTLITEYIPSISVSVSYLSIYLSITLTLGTLAVLFTIIVLCFHHRESEGQPVPNYVRCLTSCLVIITCWNGCFKFKCACTKKTRPMSPRVRPIVHVKEIAKPEKEVVEMNGPEMVDDDEKCNCSLEITWKVVANVLDHFFFLLFITVNLASSAGFLSVVVAEYMRVQADDGLVE